jgi:F-type H+-transporting ATPase subunit delta
MNARTSARQYASALFDVALRNGRTEQIQRDLSEFAALLAGHQELRQFLTDRGASESVKTAILRAVFAHIGGIADEVQRLLLWLAGRNRLVLLAEIDDAFTKRVLDVANIVNAEVTTTVALDDASRTSLRQALGRALGRDVVITERLDPAIGGGVVAKAGGVVFDGSVTRQIERVREQLLAGR